MDKSTNRLVRVLKKFKKDNNIDKIIFFGSRSRNKYNKFSDVDLIIVSSQFKNIKSYKRAPFLRPKWNLKYAVDMLCYTPDEFEARKNEPTIVREAVRGGIEV